MQIVLSPFAKDGDVNPTFVLNALTNVSSEEIKNVNQVVKLLLQWNQLHCTTRISNIVEEF